MFTSITCYRLKNFHSPDAEALGNALASAAFTPCSPSQAESSGWVPPLGKNGVALVESVGGHLLMQLCIERKAVPASAVNAALDERIEKYKAETGRERVGGKLKKEMKEEVIQELLPKAFSKRANTLVWIDPKQQTLVLNTCSAGASDKAVSLLVEALTALAPEAAGISVSHIQTESSPAACMANWLATREAPAGFTVDQECELKTPDDRKARVRYDRHTLELDEIGQHIKEGKLPTQLALTWSGRVSFVLTEKSQMKKIKLLDVVMEGAQDSDASDFHADAAISTGELSQLIPDLVDALGGEIQREQPADQTPD